MNTTPQNIIEVVLDRKTKDTQLTFYNTRLEKWLFWISSGFACLTGVAGIAAYVTSTPYAEYIAVFSLLITSILGLVFQIVSSIPDLLKLQNYEHELSMPILEEFDFDMELINELAVKFDCHNISYAKNTFTRRSKHLRERIAVLVGAVDKVGIIPMVVTGGLSFIKIKKEGIMPFGVVEWVLLVFVILYLLSVRVTLAAQWMEKVAEIYAQALSLKGQHEWGEVRSKHISSV